MTDGSFLTLSNSKEYFPVINGMRAIAVIAVIFFHLELSGFQGGYIGVDLFFVISGYLITRNIAFDLLSKQFSFKQFYIARLRRLAPAMLCTIAFTLALGFFLLPSDGLIRLAGSAIASVLSLANVRFWKASGYFDVDAMLKPLLHFWSLSIEEQFYLFWPLFLFFLFKFSLNHKKTLLVMALFFLASFISAQYMVNKMPNTAFYWLQFRAYEFILGAMLLCLELYFPRVSNSQWQRSNTLFVFGLACITMAISIYNKETLFPGYTALLPCIGGLLIIYTKQSVLANYLLANKPMLLIGTISYSLYLVHWPIWVYLSHWHFAEFSFIEKVVILALIFIAGLCLYYSVEKRFRYSKATNITNNRIRTYGSYALIAFLLVFTSWLIRDHNGFPSRVKSNYPELPLSQVNCRYIDGKRHQACVFGKTTNFQHKVLLLGDSHSMNLRYGLDQFGRTHHIYFESISFAGCPPLIGTELHYHEHSGADNQCKEFSEKINKISQSHEFDKIILSSRWMWFFEHTLYANHQATPKAFLLDHNNKEFTPKSSRQAWTNAISNTVKKFIVNRKKVLIFSQYPLLNKNIGECDKSPNYLISSHSNIERCTVKIPYQDIINRLKFTNEFIDSIANKTSSVMSIKPSDYLCNESHQTCNIMSSKGLLYADENHISKTGSSFLINAVSDDLVNFTTHKINKF